VAAVSRARVVCGIQARMSSTRLPGKVLSDLGGKALILRVLERVRRARHIEETFVLTSTDASDDPLADFLAARGVPLRRGPLADVYARYAALAAELSPDVVVRVTGDCPLVEPSFLDLQIEALAAHDGDLAIDELGGIEGTLGGQTAISARALRSVAASSDPRDREHVGSFWFVAERRRLRLVGIQVDARYRRPELRLAVDEPDDLERMRALFAAQTGAFSTLDALAWLDAHPNVRDQNAHVVESRDNRALRAERRAASFGLVGRYP
jgi:spore coat polysaccharide biosynthesis protein SpsF